MREFIIDRNSTKAHWLIITQLEEVDNTFKMGQLRTINVTDRSAPIFINLLNHTRFYFFIYMNRIKL